MQIPVHRARFEEALRNEQPGSAKGEAFLQSVEQYLAKYKHPDPYNFPVSLHLFCLLVWLAF